MVPLMVASLVDTMISGRPPVTRRVVLEPTEKPLVRIRRAPPTMVLDGISVGPNGGCNAPVSVS